MLDRRRQRELETVELPAELGRAARDRAAHRADTRHRRMREQVDEEKLSVVGEGPHLLIVPEADSDLAVPHAGSSPRSDGPLSSTTSAHSRSRSKVRTRSL